MQAYFAYNEIGRKLAIWCAVGVVPSSEIASDTNRMLHCRCYDDDDVGPS